MGGASDGCVAGGLYCGAGVAGGVIGMTGGVAGGLEIGAGVASGTGVGGEPAAYSTSAPAEASVSALESSPAVR